MRATSLNVPVAANGTGTAIQVNDELSLAYVYVTGTFAATVNIQTSADGTNWFTEASPTAAAKQQIKAAPFLRINVSGYTSGQPVCSLVTSNA